MNLAEIYLTTKDLQLLCGARLHDTYFCDTYRNRNQFDITSILPVIEPGTTRFDLRPQLIRVGRWGRHILLSFSTCTIVFKMAPQTKVLVSRGMFPDVAHKDLACLLTFDTAEGPLYFMYTDVLCGGYVSVYPVGIVPKEFTDLGLDILDTLFSGSYLMTEAMNLALSNNHRTIKSFIMDTSVIAWLDNNVASEVLFLSGLHPQLDVATELSMFKANCLVRSMVMIYYRMLECLQNDVCSVIKTKPEDVFSIYGHDDGECCVCDTRIQKISIDTYDTYICPRCQPITKRKVLA